MGLEGVAENDVAGIRQVLVSPQAGTALTQFQEVEGDTGECSPSRLRRRALEHREAILSYSRRPRPIDRTRSYAIICWFGLNPLAPIRA